AGVPLLEKVTGHAQIQAAAITTLPAEMNATDATLPSQVEEIVVVVVVTRAVSLVVEEEGVVDLTRVVAKGIGLVLAAATPILQEEWSAIVARLPNQGLGMVTAEVVTEAIVVAGMVTAEVVMEAIVVVGIILTDEMIEEGTAIEKEGAMETVTEAALTIAKAGGIVHIK
ncbi:hypothetical protein HDU76_004939, partial [Blyttiomyces sp. JEL0837]